jgi:hypothetical protein
VVDRLIKRQIIPVYNPILPRDQAAIVDEVVKLLSTNPPAISMESAQIALGRGTQEIAKIMGMLSMVEDWNAVKSKLNAANQIKDEKSKDDKQAVKEEDGDTEE